ncbi:TPR repeat family protein [Desulforapulum autotrophicum HRM2]|uniref:TPR repeat family protein n=1 Tax=Desulforapulum autotrophicum (strain ATCC 43914 / DSM 3382 / VKM B-1955 / HRM2) TaxID=177437 RepID=C0QI70_DESAH|nr:hypothetical protein [Desulforapulum autotrophicum]ACN15806.1 TPR repeat family protein [Desulforapulum autotrophicum HRM2]
MADREIYTLELGLVHEAQGHYKKATAHFSGALKNDPGNQILISALDRVASRHKDSADLSALSGLVEQWVSLVLLSQRLAILGRNLDA